MPCRENQGTTALTDSLKIQWTLFDHGFNTFEVYNQKDNTWCFRNTKAPWCTTTSVWYT